MSDAYRTETRNFWRAAQALTGEMRKEVPDTDTVEDAVSELEAIVLHTQHAFLRLAAQRMLARADGANVVVAQS